MANSRLWKVPDVVGNISDAVFCVSGEEMPISAVHALDDIQLSDPLMTKVLLPGPKASLLEYQLSRGQVIPAIRFPHDTVNFVVKGNLRVGLAGRSHDAEEKDAWTAAAGVEITVEALTDCVLLEWMGSPHTLAKDRLITWGPTVPCNSHYFTKWSETEERHIEQVEGTSEFSIDPALEVETRLRILIPGPAANMFWATDTKGKWAYHAHWHHWVCYQLKGQTKELFGAREYTVNPGGIWGAQSGAIHCTGALTDRELIEFKWPAPLIWKGVMDSWEPRWTSVPQVARE